MNVYFDLPNLRSYAKAGGYQNFQSCTNMMRLNFNIHFCFDKTQLSRERKQSKQSIMTLLKTLTRNRGNSNELVWDETFPPRPLNANVYDTMNSEQLTSIYFLSDPSVNDMVQHGCLLFAKEGDEIKTLSQLLIEKEAIPSRPYSIRTMTDWKVLEDNATPCTDIIIVDRYIFSQPDILYPFNSYKIIEHLGRFNHHELNVIIFTDKDTPFKTINSQLKNLLCKRLNLTFVIIPEGKLKEHDRTIITNYKMFDSGDSFKYFNDKGENQSHGRWLHVNSFGDKNVRDLSLQCIKDLQALINDRKNGLSSIIGDKKSLLLKF